jgi:hypothetical protein
MRLRGELVPVLSCSELTRPQARSWHDSDQRT